MTNGHPAFSTNVYRVAQRRFDAIPGSPWAYWVSDDVRALFEALPKFGEIAQPRQGVATTDNLRFLRYWWEIGSSQIVFGCQNREEASLGALKWTPYVKGGTNVAWYGNLEHVINWLADGAEIRHTIGAVIRNPDFYFLEGLTFNRFATSRLALRWLPPGYVFDCNGPAVISSSTNQILAVANAAIFSKLCSLINPGVNFQVGDVVKAPIPPEVPGPLVSVAHRCVRHAKSGQDLDEATLDFIAPPRWDTGIADQAAATERLSALEAQINDEVYRLYRISDAYRAAIEAELTGGGPQDHEGGEGDEGAKHEDHEDGEEEAAEGGMTREELAVLWISYAVGVVLGRFQPGIRGALGSAIYRRDDFAIGSLPAPNEAEFDELVGPPERFAYIDAEGGRHLLAPEVEAALRALALPDGIAVLDEGHPRDLPALAERALGLMLDEGRTTKDQSSIENLQSAIGMDLRAFLSKDFFTRWHLRWYRKRPVYWPLQSAKRSYGFVLFHERVDRLTLYTLQREYLDYKINLVRQQAADLSQAAATQSGASRRATEREAAKAAALLDELTEFARTMERIVRGGYEPEPNWIDDGVILRLAPLWELLPLWKSEPKKHWERLEHGDFDWSHVAMKYWPDRVRAKCKANKSFAIAHGHEEWYVG